MKSLSAPKLARTLLLCSLLSLGLSSAAHAQTGFWDSFSESLYEKILPSITPAPAPVLYPSPQTGQPIPWTPIDNPNIYGPPGVRG